MSEQPPDGIAAMRAKRERAKRQTPPPRHPRPPKADTSSSVPATEDVASARTSATDAELADVVPNTDVGDTTDAAPTTSVPVVPDAISDAMSGAISREISPGGGTAESGKAPVAQRATSSPPATGSRARKRGGRPALDVDPRDPLLRVVTPTVVTVRASVMRRFKQARQNGPKHTDLVLAAIRAHADALPDLVRARRPQAPVKDDLFPWRPGTAAGADEPREHLRIRPLAGEWQVITQLTAWVNDQLDTVAQHAEEVTRSEVIDAALDEYLPPVGD